METTVKERLIEFIEYKGLNKYNFEKTCGFSTGFVSNMRVSLQPKKIMSIASNFPDLNTGWLLTGEGSMIKAQVPSIMSRLNLFMLDQGITEIEFCKLIEIPHDFYTQMQGAIPERYLKSIISKFPQLNIAWLMAGEGNMIKSESSSLSISNSKGRPYYNVDFIGGFDIVLNDQTITPEYNIDFAPYNKDGVMWCNITGKSMEPEISNGDMMAIKEVYDWDKYLTMNETYAIVTKNDLRTVKKVKKGMDSNHLTLVPVNKEFDEQEISKDMILRVFSVMGCMKRF